MTIAADQTIPPPDSSAPTEDSPKIEWDAPKVQWDKAPAWTPVHDAASNLGPNPNALPSAQTRRTPMAIGASLSKQLENDPTFKALPPEEKQKRLVDAYDKYADSYWHNRDLVYGTLNKIDGKTQDPSSTNGPESQYEKQARDEYNADIARRQAAPQDHLDTISNRIGIDYRKGAAASFGTGAAQGLEDFGSQLNSGLPWAGIQQSQSMGTVNPDRGFSTGAGHVVGMTAPTIATSLIPGAGQTLAGGMGVAQGIGSARQEGQAQGWSDDQTAAVATERGLFNAALAALPGGQLKPGMSIFKEMGKTAIKTFLLNEGQAGVDAAVKNATGIADSDVSKALIDSAMNGESWAQVLLFSAMHGANLRMQMPGQKEIEGAMSRYGVDKPTATVIALREREQLQKFGPAPHIEWDQPGVNAESGPVAESGKGGPQGQPNPQTPPRSTAGPAGSPNNPSDASARSGPEQVRGEIDQMLQNQSAPSPWGGYPEQQPLPEGGLNPETAPQNSPPAPQAQANAPLTPERAAPPAPAEATPPALVSPPKRGDIVNDGKREFTVTGLGTDKVLAVKPTGGGPLEFRPMGEFTVGPLPPSEGAGANVGASEASAASAPLKAEEGVGGEKVQDGQANETPGDSAMPTGSGSKYGRSGPERPTESTALRDEGKIKQEYSRRAIERKLLDWQAANDEPLGRPDKNTPVVYHDVDGNPITLEQPVLPPDALDGMKPIEKARLSKYVDEDHWSNITQHMDARQIARLQDEMLRRVTETKADQLNRAIKEAKESNDPRAQFLANYHENTPPRGEQVPKQWLDVGKLSLDHDYGKTFEIHGEKFTVDADPDGNLILRDHITIEHPEELGKIPIDKGTLKDPEEQAPEDFAPPEPSKNIGQGSLLGDRFEGSNIGSKTASMFGDTSRGAANELEAQTQREAAAARSQVDKGQTSLLEREVPAADKSKGELDKGDQFPLPGTKPKDKFPVVTDVRMTPDGQRQYQVRFSEKTDAQWMPPARRVTDGELGKTDLNVDPENKSRFGEGSIGAAEDAAALARAKARDAATAQTPPTLLAHAAQSLGNAAKVLPRWLQNFRSRFNFLTERYGKAGTDLAQPLGELVTARQTAAFQGNTAADRVLQGLDEHQRSELVSLGLDGRRQLDNRNIAQKFADALLGKPKGPTNKLAGASTPHTRVAEAVFAALDAPDSFDRDTLAFHIADKLHAIDPGLVTQWTDLAAENPAFRPESLAAGEARRASQLIKLDDAARGKILAQKPIAEAIARWKKEVEPTLLDLRAKNGKPIDPRWDSVPLALNFVGNGEGMPPFEPSPGIRIHDPYQFKGEGLEKETDPRKYLSKIVSDHLVETREKAAIKAVADSPLNADAKLVHLAEDGPNKGKMVGTVDGKEIPVTQYDVARELDPAKKDARWLPADLVKELQNINAQERPDNSRGIGSFIIGLGLKGKAAMHAFGALSRTSQELAARGGFRAENLAPWIGARAGTVIRGIRDAFSPVGDMHHAMLEDLGSAGTRGFASAHSDQTFADIWAKRGQAGLLGTAKESALKIFGIDHDVLFAPKVGAENILRSQLLDSFLSTKFGSDYATIKDAVKAGKTSPLEASQKMLDRLTPQDHRNAQAFINDTLGWLDRGTRGQAMNKARNFFSFIGTEASTIPGDIRRALTGNLDLAGIRKQFKAGDMKGAALKTASGLLAGPMGAYVFANLLNLAINGRLMKDNDEGHKLDVHLGGGWYFGLDSAIQRGERIIGMKDLANGGKENIPTTLGREAYSELHAVVNPAYGMLVKAAAALGGVKSEYSPTTNRNYTPKIGDIAPVPYLTNTVRDAASGRGAGTGLAKDAAMNLLGQSVTHASPDAPKTKADALARELSYQSGSEPTPEELAKSDLHRQAAQLFRDHKGEEARQLIKSAPDVTPADVRNIEERAKQPNDFAWRLSKLSAADTMKVWAAMTYPEKLQYRKTMQQNVATSKTITADQRKQFAAELAR